MAVIEIYRLAIELTGQRTAEDHMATGPDLRIGHAEREAAAQSSGLGPYALQAEIAACHARAHTAAETDWARIALIYDALSRVAPSPVVELNRAVAVSMADGPAAGLALVDALLEEPALSTRTVPARSASSR